MFAKKFLISFLTIFLFLGFFAPGSAAIEQGTVIHYFYSEICPVCREAGKFLGGLQEKYPEIKINHYEVADPQNREILEELAKKTGAEKYIGMVPLFFIGERFFLGFNESIGREIEDYIAEPSAEPDKKIILPFVGEINPADFSLPVLAVVLGFLDGFNICSLGALVLILSLVIGLRSRKKVLFFGGLFILTTAVVYGFLMTMWSLFFSLLGVYMRNMQILVGGLALAGGIYFFWQFLKFRKKGPVCEMETGEEIKSKFLKKIKESFKNSKNFFLLAGIVLAFAFLVTVIEFPCSAVVPIIFTSILAEANLDNFLTFLYIALFVAFYMLDEIIVFLLAVFTMRLWLVSGKFITYAALAQAVILSLLGVYYIFGI